MPPRKVKYPPLTPEQQALVRENYKFVYKIAMEIKKIGHQEDLIAEGFLGLCIAAVKFDKTRNVKFTTYSAYWIKAFMIGYLLRYHGPTHITSSDRNLFFEILKAQNRLRENGDDEVTTIAEELHQDPRTVGILLSRVRNSDVKLDAPTPNGFAPFQLTDREPLPDESAADGEEASALRARVQWALGFLTPRERHIIEARILTNDEKRTLVDLGEELGGLSRERIRQIEAMAKAKLRGLLQPGLPPVLVARATTPTTTAAPAAAAPQARARRA